MKNKSREILQRALTNISQSEVDDAVQENISFRSETGLKNKIIRESSGHCCAWCDALAGVYDADDAPEDIYRRHDNCTCTVYFKSEKGYENVHSKKYISKDLEELIEKHVSKEQYINVNKKTIGLEKDIAKSNFADDVTNEYRKTSYINPGNIKIPEDMNVKASKNVNEYNIAKVLSNLSDETIELLKESNKNNVKTADYLWHGKLWELKSVEKNSKNAIDSAVRKGLSQISNNAGGLVIDITSNSMGLDEMIKTIDYRYKRSGNNSKIDIIFIKDGKLYKVLRYK